MKKKLLFVLVFLFMIGFMFGCQTEENTTNEKALEFKTEYEALNGKTNKSGKVHRTITIDENNPFEKVSAEEIVNKLENKETFYVYFGDELCPWCRSVIEKAIEVANKKGIKKIYYVKIWDSEGNEVLRDKYELTPILTKTIEGTDSYKTLLEKFDSLLSEYTVTDPEGHKITTEEKRIFAPNFIYVENGVAIRLAEGYSDKQEDSRQELTKELLDDEEKIFNEFFK